MFDSRPREEFLPTASIETLRQRAKLITALRQFFNDAGFFEVETPLLSADIVVDAWLEPFVADWIPTAESWASGGQPRYLQTSPEFAMKRLVAAGADSIYQLGKVFRNGEFGQRHNPEFTMLEWYRRADNLSTLMDFTEALVRQQFLVAADWTADSSPRHNDLIQRLKLGARFERLTYDEAFQRATGHTVLDRETIRLPDIAQQRGLLPPPGLEPEDRDGWLNFLLAELIEPTLGRDCPTFLTNYPASQAALAKLSADGRTSERFELYINGVELCNGYDELTDPAALRARIQEQARLRSRAGLRPLPATNRLLAAMDVGLPTCSGNALGVDRLIMLALNKSNLGEVIPFPFDIA